MYLTYCTDINLLPAVVTGYHVWRQRVDFRVCILLCCNPVIVVNCIVLYVLQSYNFIKIKAMCQNTLVYYLPVNNCLVVKEIYR